MSNRGKLQIEVWDTSALIAKPQELERNPGHIVVPSIDIKELMGLKKRQDLVGANARTALNILEKLEVSGELSNDQNSISKRVTIRYKMADPDKLPSGFDPNEADEKIVRVALALREEGHDVTLVSTDIDVRLMGFACNIPTRDFGKDYNIEKIEDVYSGTANLEVELASNVQSLFDHKLIPARDLISNKEILDGLYPNQCCYLTTSRNGKDKVILALYKKRSGSEPQFKLVNKKPIFDELYTGNSKIIPRNAEQAFAYEMLIDPDIHLVAISGKARTGKTLMALLAGYDLLETKFDKLSVFRPIIEMGIKDLGYLPGTIEEKFAPWATPIIKNLNLIIGGRGASKAGVASKSRREESEMSSARDFIERDMLEILPANYVLGDTWMKQFVILDEAQNFQPGEIKMLVTRTGYGTKVIVTGDPFQTFHPHCDSLSNGLIHVIENTKGQEFFGHIRMVKGEGHMLAEFAADHY